MKIETKRKISIVDVIIIIAMLASMLAVGIGVFKGIGTSGEKVTVKYVLEVDPIDSDFVSRVAEGNTILDHKTTQSIGKVSAVSNAQAYYSGIDSQGSVVSSPMEGMSVLYITVTAQATKTDTGYTVGSSVINIGKEIEARLPNLYCIGNCVSIEIID